MDKFVLLLHLQTALTSLMKKLREWIVAQKYIRGPDADGAEGQVLATDGKGGKAWTTVEASGAAAAALEEAKTYTNKAVEAAKGGNDHAQLYNREAKEQHPIDAITNLDTALQNRVNVSDALTNMEIEKILGGLM